MTRFNPQSHPFDQAQDRHRRSIRLPGYDYSQPGAYFITLVTFQREGFFGEIQNGEMNLSLIGQIADEAWKAIPDHFPNVELDAYVIMPDHVHGIIVIHEHRRGTIYRAPTDYRAPTPTSEQFGKPVAGSIPTIVRTYKAAVTRQVGREYNLTNLWQRNYYEHIIRNDKDLQATRSYILNNPLNWEKEDESLP